MILWSATGLARLSDQLGVDAEITLIDKADAFVFGFSELEVMFGRAISEAVRHPYQNVIKPGVRFVQTTIRSIDLAERIIARHRHGDAGIDL